MKLVIVNDASVARGGATGLALLQARLMRERGIETVFAAADEGGNDGLQDLGVRCYAAGGTPLMKLPAHLAATRGLYNRDVRQMMEDVIEKEDGPDTVYHVHSWSKTLTPAVFSALQKVADRCFVHIHDFFLACPNGGFMDYQSMTYCQRRPLSMGCLTTHCDKRSRAQKAWRVSRQLILRRTLPRSANWAGLLLIHPEMGRRLEESGYRSEQLVEMRNPATALSKDRLKAEDQQGLVFIGRVEAEKGVEDLIVAAKQAGAALTIVGDGPLREPLKKAHPDVTFAGWQDRDGMLEASKKARALVMPSRYPEPFGLVAAEGSLSGLPVIVSKDAFLAKEIVENQIGWSCDTKNADSFSSLLRDVINLPSDEIEAMSRRAFSGVAGLCQTPDEWISSQLSAYETACTASAKH